MSPDFPIMKKNGTIRLVVDYREINKVSIPDSFLFPDLHQEIRSILKSKYFSQIDLLKISPNKVEKRSVEVYGFHYTGQPVQVYSRSLCIKNAPGVFQRV